MDIEKAERDKGCEYCSLPIGKSITLQDGNWLFAQITHTEDEYVLTVEGDGKFEIILEYCPKCGRKLGE